uniref:Bacterial surface antigen (D15) domain-containing protein n=1 Tax=Favella ehrenbergii TaxID=182087 RepID=A0A7S3MK24_9SPIT|mmetsp:Transcript_13248/g.16825  ORF Transcript_13248/g.16825 Transcript_13248/m.16825 type:complete len:187 (+) Transcript_13248:629-1189(+)
MRHQRMWPLVRDKINLVTELHAGRIWPLFSARTTFTNDRFFVYNTQGFLNIGHTESSLKPLQRPYTAEEMKAENEDLSKGLHKVVMGDDMGADQFAYLAARLDYLNMPFFGDKGFKVFSQAELIYYPTEGREEKFVDTLRASMGFGISWPLTPMINFGLYYSAVNLNSRVGDIERSSAIGFAFNFF